MTNKRIRKVHSYQNGIVFWQKHNPPYAQFVLIGQHAGAILFGLAFLPLNLRNLLFWFHLLVTPNIYIAESVAVLLSFQTFFLTLWLLRSHDRPNLCITPTTYNRTAFIYYEIWKDCLWYNISNNTLLWNKVNPALPAPPNFCQNLYKHRPPKFRDGACSPCRLCLAIAHLFV
jgi:hypothetical protein